MLWAAFVSFIGGVALFKSAQYLPYLTAFFSLCLFLFLSFKYKNKNKITFLFLIPLIMAGGLYAAYRYQPPPAYSAQKKHIEASLTGYASLAVRQKYGFSQLFHLTDISFPDPEDQKLVKKNPFPFEEVRIYTQIPLSPARLYRLHASLSLPARQKNPGASDFALKPQAEVQRVISCGAAPWHERLRSRLSEYYGKNFPADEAGFLMSITMGERAMLDWRTRRDFSNCGLAHLISIAGMHFGLFSLSIFLIIRILIGTIPLKWLERMTLQISPVQIAALAGFPLLSGYLMLSGMRIPALRAFIMISFFLTGLLIERKRAWQATLAFAAFLLVLWRPDVICNLSFELSFLSVLLIGLFASELKIGNDTGENKGSNRLSPASKKVTKAKKYIFRVLLLSLSITAGLMPLIAFYFHRVQLISPLANLCVVPVAGFLLVPVAVLSGFIYLLSGWYPFPFLSGWLASVSMHMAHFFSSLPHVCPPVPAFPAGLLFLFYGLLAISLYSKKRVWLAFPVLPFIIWAGVHMCSAPALGITFLDAGAGDSAVAELPYGRTAVIDTGTNGRETSDFLAYLGKNRIDYLVLTNSRHGNAGGAGYLADRYSIGQVWDNGITVNEGVMVAGHMFPLSAEKIPEKCLSRGEYIEGPLSGRKNKGAASYRITILHPYANFFPLHGPEPQAVDNSSLVMKIEDQWGKSALFAGDTGRLAQQDMLRLAGILHSDIYKVPHHGSDTDLCSPFIAAVHPAIAVISPGDRGRTAFFSGHENTIQALSDCGSKVLRTDTDGAVKAEFDKNGVHIKTWKEEQLKKFPDGFKEEAHNLMVLFSSW